MCKMVDIFKSDKPKNILIKMKTEKRRKLLKCCILI